MSSVIKDLNLHKKVDWSRRLDWIVSDNLWTAPFGTLVFRGISDNPNPALKRLTILFLALEGKGLLAPCIRRQRFTRIVKAPKQISCHLELGNLNFHVLIMCKPMYTATHHRENRYRFKIAAVVVYIFCKFPIKPQNLQPKNKLPC